MSGFLLNTLLVSCSCICLSQSAELSTHLKDLNKTKTLEIPCSSKENLQNDLAHLTVRIFRNFIETSKIINPIYQKLILSVLFQFSVLLAFFLKVLLDWEQFLGDVFAGVSNFNIYAFNSFLKTSELFSKRKKSGST